MRHLLTRSSVPDAGTGTGTGLSAEACVGEEAVRFCFGGRSGVVDGSGSTSGSPHSSGGGATVADRVGRGCSRGKVRSGGGSRKRSSISVGSKKIGAFKKVPVPLFPFVNTLTTSAAAGLRLA